MQPARKHRLRNAIVAAAALAAIALASGAWLARGPDFEIRFHRSTPSRLDAETLGRSLQLPINWSRWFRDLKEAKILDVAGRPLPMRDQVVMPGSRVRLWIEPKGREWKRFELLTVVRELEPSRRLVLALVEDSRGRIPKTVEGLTWVVTLEPDATGLTSHTVGVEVRGRTTNWKSRLVSRIAPRVALNQLIYPDPMLLAGLSEPSAANPFLPSKQ